MAELVLFLLISLSLTDRIQASTSSLLPDTVDASDHPNLGLLNFLYDVSRPEDVTAVVTETAIIPVVSVPFVLREHKPINMGG